MFTFLLVLFIIDVFLLIIVILMQSGSGAEAGMFGSSLTLGAFGAKSSEVLVGITRWLVGLFMVLAFMMGYIRVQESKALTGTPATSVSEDTGDSTATTLETEEGGVALPLGVTETSAETTEEAAGLALPLGDASGTLPTF